MGIARNDRLESSAVSTLCTHSQVTLSAQALWTGMALSVVASVVLFFIATRHGIGVVPDTLRYMGLVEKPADAPLYGWILRGVAATGLDIFDGATLLALLLLAVNTGLIWYLLAIGTGNLIYTTLGTGLMILSPLFVLLHWSAMSEPLFLFFQLAAIALILQHRRAFRWVVFAGIIIGLATLARLPGVALGPALALFLLLDRRVSLGRRLASVGILFVTSVAVVLAWVLPSMMSTGGQVGGREMVLHGAPDASVWTGALGAMATMFLPSPVPFAIDVAFLVVVVLGTAAMLAYFLARSPVAPDAATPGRDIATNMVFFSLFYAAIVILAVFVEANLTIEPRYVFPLYPVVVIVGAIALARSGLGRSSRWIGAATLGITLIVGASHLLRTSRALHAAYFEGMEYSSVAWNNSPIIAAVRELPDTAVLYTNGPDAIRYLAERGSTRIPEVFDRRTGEENPLNPLSKQMTDLCNDLADGRAYIVLLDKVDWRFYLVSEEVMIRDLRPDIIKETTDGRIYTGCTGYRPTAANAGG